MVHQFTKENIDAIANVLGSEAKPLGDDVYRLEVENREEGRKLAQMLLGHQSMQTTQIYIDPDMQRAMDALRKIG